jgi:hypothetical protein
LKATNCVDTLVLQMANREKLVHTDPREKRIVKELKVLTSMPRQLRTKRTFKNLMLHDT